MWIWEKYHSFEEEKTLTVVYFEKFEEKKNKTKKRRKMSFIFLNIQPEHVDELKRGNVSIPNGRFRVQIK